jgi:hypothetical protein
MEVGHFLNTATTFRLDLSCLLMEVIVLRPNWPRIAAMEWRLVPVVLFLTGFGVALSWNGWRFMAERGLAWWWDDEPGSMYLPGQIVQGWRAVVVGFVLFIVGALLLAAAGAVIALGL